MIKLLIGIVFGVSLWLIVVGISFGIDLPKLVRIWPDFSNSSSENHRDLEYIVERVRHRIEDGKEEKEDMRNGVYLTHHRYFLENVANWKWEYADRKFSLNDICYKPHYELIKTSNSRQTSAIHKKIEIEARKASPCLIVSPLNCFYDSYKLHSDISEWNSNVEIMNGEIRSLWEENGTKPYVKGNTKLEIIDGWSKIVDRKWYEKIEEWIASLKPKSKVCADPLRSCEDLYDAQNYFNMCTIMSTFNDYDSKNEITLKFELDDDDSELMTKLDCVEDRELFIEWAKEKELLNMIDVISPNMSLHLPNYEKILDGPCNGVFGEGNEDKLFSGSYDGDFVFEIFLMNPEDFLSSLNQQNNKINWTLSDSNEIINIWRTNIRSEAIKWNSKKLSEKLKIVTEVVSLNTEDEKNPEKNFIIVLSNQFLTVLILSTIFLWNSTIIYSTSSFIARTFFGFIVVFNYFDGSSFSSKIMIFTGFLIVLNMILTSWISKRWRTKRKNDSQTIAETKESMRSISMASSVFENWTNQEMLQYFDNYLRKASESEFSNWFRINSAIWVLLIIPCLIIENFVELFVLIGPSIGVFMVERYFRACKDEKCGNLIDRIKNCRKRLIERIDEEGIEMVNMAGCSETIQNSPKRTPTVSRRHIKSIHKIQNYIQYYSSWFYYHILFLSRRSAIYIYSISTLCFLLSLFVILFWNPSPIPSTFPKQYSEDVFVDIKIENLARNWQRFLDFEKEMKNYAKELTNWRNGFEIYMKKRKLCISDGCRDKLSFETFYTSWFAEDKLSSSISAKSAQPNFDVFDDIYNPSIFKFRLRYDVLPKNFENFLQLCDQYHVTPIGNAKEFAISQKNYKIRNNFTRIHLLSTISILIISLVFITIFFNWKFAVVFGIFGIFTRIEIGAVIWILFRNSEVVLENHQIIADFSCFLGLLIAWKPLISLFAYQNRIRTSIQRDELAGKEETRKPAIPIAHFVDTANIVVVLSCVWLIGSLTFLAIFDFRTTFSISFLSIFALLTASLNSMTMISKIPDVFDSQVRIVMESRKNRLKTRAFFIRQKSDTSPESSFYEEEEEEFEEEDEEEDYESEEDFDSEDEPDEEVLALVEHLESKLAQSEKAEFLKNIVAADKNLKILREDETSLEKRKERLLEDLKSQPSCSTANHQYADYFPPDFTSEMIDFMIDPKYHGGKPWVPPAVPPPRAELAQATAFAKELYESFLESVQMAEVGIPVPPIEVVPEPDLESSDEDEGFGGGGDESD